MPPSEQQELLHDLRLELVRLGMGVSEQECDEQGAARFSMTYWMEMAIDATLTEASFVDRVHHVRRADYLVQQLVRHHANRALFSQQSTPDIQSGPP